MAVYLSRAIDSNDDTIEFWVSEGRQPPCRQVLYE